MPFKILVLAKQVPDTRNVGDEAMKADGTVNRGALPAIFNPEDLNALEQALALKDHIKDCTVQMITMGPPRAAEIIRDGLYRGIDKGYLVTDKRFAGADTLATSYVLSEVIKNKFSDFDMILCGRQAIDGDTAQVGPQTAEKLDIPQVTYAEAIEILQDLKTLRIKRRLERGIETIEVKIPVLVTVHSSAPKCRPKNAKNFMRYKYAKTTTERQSMDDDYLTTTEHDYLKIEEISLNDIHCDMDKIGLKGSPTKVKKIANVVRTAKDSLKLEGNSENIKNLVQSLINNHILG